MFLCEKTTTVLLQEVVNLNLNVIEKCKKLISKVDTLEEQHLLLNCKKSFEETSHTLKTLCKNYERTKVDNLHPLEIRKKALIEEELKKYFF